MKRPAIKTIFTILVDKNPYMRGMVAYDQFEKLKVSKDRDDYLSKFPKERKHGARIAFATFAAKGFIRLGGK